MLEQFKFEYQSTVKTEHKLESSIKLLVKQCGSLSSTEEYLTTVSTTLNALGDCPGLGEVQFQLPTWTGQWVKFNQKRDKCNKWNDAEMFKQCTKQFGKGTRVAEVSEIDGQSIEGMPRLMKYYDVRAEARTGEIDAMGKAKDVLNGADY